MDSSSRILLPVWNSKKGVVKLTTIKDIKNELDKYSEDFQVLAQEDVGGNGLNIYNEKGKFIDWIPTDFPKEIKE